MKKIFALLLLLLPGLAFAHHFMGDAVPQTFMQGLLSGLGHPLIGVDHAAFIIAAGFFLALVKGGIWGVTALIAGSLAGASLHLSGFGLPGAEAGVALSLALAGALLVFHKPIRLSWLVAGFGIAGVLHGHAYAESIFGAEPAPLAAYLIGFSVIQFALAAAALLAHRRVMGARMLSAALGAAVGAIGVTFLIINIA